MQVCCGSCFPDLTDVCACSSVLKLVLAGKISHAEKALMGGDVFVSKKKVWIC